MLDCVQKSGEVWRNLSEINWALKPAALKMEVSPKSWPVMSEARLVDLFSSLRKLHMATIFQVLVINFKELSWNTLPAFC